MQRQAGQPEQALTPIGLLQQPPGSFQETKDRLVGLAAALRAALSAEQVQAALARGLERELWSAVVEIPWAQPGAT